MNKLLLITGALLAVNFTTRAQSTIIADWTFETSAPVGTGANAGPLTPEVGTGIATGSHASSATVYSSPSGNGSTHSFSANTWAVGDYYQYQVSTLGYTGDYLTLSFDQAGSSTGPKTFQLEYSLDGTTFNNIGSTYTVAASTWTPSTVNSSFTYTPDLSSLTGLVNQATVYFRMADAATTSIGNGTVAATGTDRMDNVIIGVTPIPVPEPQALALLGIGISGVCLLRRRR